MRFAAAPLQHAASAASQATVSYNGDCNNLAANVTQADTLNNRAVLDEVEVEVVDPHLTALRVSFLVDRACAGSSPTAPLHPH